jgi:hypothetical protein
VLSFSSPADPAARCDPPVPRRADDPAPCRDRAGRSARRSAGSWRNARSPAGPDRRRRGGVARDLHRSRFSLRRRDFGRAAFHGDYSRPRPDVSISWDQSRLRSPYKSRALAIVNWDRGVGCYLDGAELQSAVSLKLPRAPGAPPPGADLSYNDPEAQKIYVSIKDGAHCHDATVLFPS